MPTSQGQHGVGLQRLADASHGVTAKGTGWGSGWTENESPPCSGRPRAREIGKSFRLPLLAAAVCVGCLLCVTAASAQVTGTTDPTANLPGAQGLQSGDVGGMITGNERFLRENRQAGQFVGGAAEGVGALRAQDPLAGPGTPGATTPFGTTNRFGAFSPFSPFGMNPMGSMYQQGLYNQLSRQRRPLRMPVQIGFTAPAVTSAAKTPVAERVQTRLARVPQLRANPGAVKVEMDGRIAVLTGQVASEHDRDLIGRLLLLEPGIGDVRNELTVKSPTDSKPAP